MLLVTKCHCCPATTFPLSNVCIPPQSDHGSPRFETPPQERLVTPKMEEDHHHHHRGGDSAESSTHNSPDPLPLALHADSGAFGEWRAIELKLDVTITDILVICVLKIQPSK